MVRDSWLLFNKIFEMVPRKTCQIIQLCLARLERQDTTAEFVKCFISIRCHLILFVDWKIV